jgi:hypothetical protein
MFASLLLRFLCIGLLSVSLAIFVHGDDATSRFPPATESQAWSKLGLENPKLPIWARILAELGPHFGRIYPAKHWLHAGT